MSQRGKDRHTQTQSLEEIERMRLRLQEMQESREASEARFRMVFEASRDAVVIMDREGVCVQANPAAATLFGLPLEQILGRRISDFLNESIDFPALWRAFLTTGNLPGEIPLVRADGQGRYAECYGITNLVADHHLWVIRDVTARKQRQREMAAVNERLQIQAEELESQTEELRVQTEELRVQTDELAATNAALQHSEERLRLAQQAGRVGVFDRDLQNNTAFWTPELEELFGIRAGTFAGKPEDWAKRVYPEDLPRMMSLLQEWMQSERTEATWEYRFIRADGQVRWMEGRGRIFRDPNGRPLRMIGTNTDITERKRAEEARRESEERYHRLFNEDLTGDFIATPDGKVLECNPTFAQIYGFADREHALACDLSRFNPADWTDLMARLRAECKVQGHQCVHRRPDGKEVHVVANVIGRFDEAAELVEVQGYLYDDTERWRAEEALRKSEEKFAKAFRSSPIAVVVTRLSDGHILEANEATLKLLHFRRDELIGHTSLDLALWLDVKDRVQFIQKISSAGSARDLEYRLRTQDGAIVTVHLSAELLEFSGEPCLLSTLVDVTERKRAEETLRESEERLKRTQEIAHLGSWELDLVNDRLSWSDEAYRIFGLAPQEFKATYEAFLETVHSDDRAAVDAAYSGSLREGRDTYEIEHRIVRRSTGEIRIVHEKCEHVRDASGRTVRSVGMVHDITERKHTEAELRRSEEQFHRLFEDDLTGNFISTPGGQILLCNPAFAQIFGFPSAQDAVGTSMLDLYPDPTERESLLARLKQEGKTERLEVWRKRRDGEPIYVVENLVGHFTNRGDLYEIKGYIFDDTDRKRAEEALRELTATLESNVAQRTAELQHRMRQLQKLTLELSETEDRERRQLAEILHDDLQQQLAAAKFHLSLLNSRAKQDPAQQAIVAQVDQILMEAIQKSRSLSHELSPAVLYHGDFAGALSWLAGQLQTKHGLEVKVDAFSEVHIESEALKTFLYKAAQEMLFNVVKHARVNEARIRVRRFRRCICLSVSDRGRGFDPQEVRQTAGFGLLSIRERVELLGGRMKMHSLKGHGSTFHVVVPDGPWPEGRGRMTEDGRQKAEGGVPPSALRPPSAPRVRVLLADDHEIVREGLISLLSDARDIEVVGEAANGREAVNQAYRLQPDVVVMDVAMPLINGDDATRQIKLHLPRTRVIALSMYEEPDMVEKMRRAGAEAYILKTAPSEELIAAIRGKKPQPAPT
jgi:PAS domain S-box-containing protein